ncbi:predicted protein [Chaetomium globosum CBS 148.51]|uniref:Uncharacterized protein n=1 Tax=Chaetomium globosum (strain ATCC 6205 / CBS 148.51 / DSM 1962 / NBRC 6347 / NRRL 1970) TaxID=306901 RepID=Q2GSK0_CHAGB|nr:uncharacterized protein CHGG_09054 [Chaetomium globosum CBS 148.51]EAQ85040.1 predicted protein [Chaetomium globosum CBS 148.51]
MGGFVFSPPVDGLDTLEPAPCPLIADDLAEYFKFLDFPETTEGDIKDKIRRSPGKKSAQLEILTLAVAICGVPTYVVYWYKPKDVTVPISASIKSNKREQSLDVLAEATIWHVCTILTITLPPLGLLGIPLSQSTWRQGNPWDFLSATIRVLRELCWQLESPQEKMEANLIRGRLDDFYNINLFQRYRAYTSTQIPYRNLLRSLDEASTLECDLRQRILDFVDKKGTFQNRPDLDLPPGYSSNLHRLFRLIDGHGSKKMVEEVARLGVFPRRSLLPTAFNTWLVYITMGLYCVARLVLVAVGLSSLRAMPQAVYKSTWADYFPAI